MGKKLIIAVGIIVVGIIIMETENKDSKKQVIQSTKSKYSKKQVIQSMDDEILCDTESAILGTAIYANISNNFPTKQASRDFVDRGVLRDGDKCLRLTEGTDLIIIKSIPISSEMQDSIGGNYSHTLVVKLPTGFTAWAIR